SAGFLRIPGGAQPLDRSPVHPEAYPIVERILADLGRPLAQVMGDAPLLRNVDPGHYTNEQFGLPTVRDILRELEKPGRDPRPEFKTATFQEGVEDLKDLRPGMLLEGVITNVTNFGAFVDIGVHQDGLVHVSMLANRFVKDPREVVKAGDIVKVKVLEIDLQRRRIALTMKLDAAPAVPPRTDRDRSRGDSPRGGQPRGQPRGGQPRGDRPRAEPSRGGDGVMAEALTRALRK